MLNLIVVAHPDDEILGFGGTGYIEKQKGNTVQPLILCGEVEARRNKPANYELYEDMKKANSFLGFNEPILGNFPNLKMNMVPHVEIVQFIEKFIKKFSPDYIFTHHPYDLNDDHRQVAHACMAASRISQRQKSIKSLRGLYFMEILSSTEWSFNSANHGFKPNLFCDITDSIDLKIKALSCYRNVMRDSPHPRSESCLKSLSIYRGAQIGCLNAEAFEVCFQKGLNV